MKKPLTPQQALARLQDLCSRSEQCSADLAKKMQGWGISSGNIEKILALLVRDKFVDDNRFAAAFACDKYRFAGWGRIKIARQLASKRIAPSVISSALQEIDNDEYAAIALKALKAKTHTIKEGNTYEGRTKLFRFGVTRGYETSLISGLIKSGAVWD